MRQVTVKQESGSESPRISVDSLADDVREILIPKLDNVVVPLLEEVRKLQHQRNDKAELNEVKTSD